MKDRNAVLDAARCMCERGFAVVPIPYKSKAPVIEGWQDLRIDAESVTRYFNNDRLNIGVLCGEPSSGLADIDCDCDEAIRAALLILPQTRMLSGRESAKHSHRWFKVINTENLRTRKFQDIGLNGKAAGEMIIELRWTGTQTLVPPSIHPEGEPYVWHGQWPIEVEATELVDAVVLTASVALLARHWFENGARHAGSLALAGFLLRRGLSVEKTGRLISNAAAIAGDEEADKRARCVTDTAESLDLGRAVTGGCRLKEYLPKGVADKLVDWLGLQKGEPASTVKRTDINAAATDSPLDQTSEKKSAAIRLVEYADDATLFVDERQEPHARFPGKYGNEIWPVRSRTFRQWLAYRHFQESGAAVGRTALEDATNLIEAKAKYEGSFHPLNVRTARTGTGEETELWLDLCDPAWRAIRITRMGWEVVVNPPILFRRYSANSPQVDPVRGGNIVSLRQFLNVRDDDAFMLLAASLVAAFFPHIPHPIPIFHGEKGAAKSTAARIFSRLVDPTPLETRSIPRDKGEWIQAVDHAWTVVLDNVSRLQEWLSDCICRAVTGEADSKRALYTDADDIIFSFRRVVVITGIEAAAQESDVLDRSVLLPLDRIAEEDRKPETELLEAFEAARPYLLGALLDAASGVLRELPSVRLDRHPRMADFARIGVALEKVLGWPRGSFLGAYFRNIGEQHEEAVGASVLGEAIRALMLTQNEWIGTCSELLTTLTGSVGELASKQREWPKTPSILSSRLKGIASNLRAVGIDYSPLARTNGAKRIQLTNNVAKTPSSSSPASPLSRAERNNETPRSDGDGDGNTLSERGAVTHETEFQAQNPLGDGSDARDDDFRTCVSDEDCCRRCGSQDWWRKPSDDSSVRSSWRCSRCHPPTHLKENEVVKKSRNDTR